MKELVIAEFTLNNTPVILKGMFATENPYYFFSLNSENLKLRKLISEKYSSFSKALYALFDCNTNNNLRLISIDSEAYPILKNMLSGNESKANKLIINTVDINGDKKKAV